MAIMVKDYANGDTAVSYEDGKRCLRDELDLLERENHITLDFDGISYVISAFLNPVIGDLILQKGPDIMGCVTITNANVSILKKIKMVKDGALIKREDME